MSDIEFKGDTEKEKQLNKEIFNCTLTIAQKDDEIRELKSQLQQKENIIKEVREYVKIKMEIRKNCENVYDYCIRNDDYIKQVDEILEILGGENNDK